MKFGDAVVVKGFEVVFSMSGIIMGSEGMQIAVPAARSNLLANLGQIQVTADGRRKGGNQNAMLPPCIHSYNSHAGKPSYSVCQNPFPPDSLFR